MQQRNHDYISFEDERNDKNADALKEDSTLKHFHSLWCNKDLTIYRF